MTGPDVFRQLARAEALMELLALPDPPELVRGHRLTQPGKPGREQRKRALILAWAQYQLAAREPEMLQDACLGTRARFPRRA